MNIILSATVRALILNVSDVIRQTAPAKGDALRAAVSGRRVISLGCWRTECDRDAVAALLEGARGLTTFTDEVIGQALDALGVTAEIAKFLASPIAHSCLARPALSDLLVAAEIDHRDVDAEAIRERLGALTAA